MEIRLEHIHKIYMRGRRNHTVLKDINMTIPTGKLLVVEGRSGSGKSTLLNIIAGLSKPTGGVVYYDKERISEWDENKKAEMRRSIVGIVTQDSGLVPYLTVYENVNLSNYICKKNDKVLKADQLAFRDKLLEDLGLVRLKNEYPANLSGGEIKRVAIARALVGKPKILIMDEPTANLDKENVERVWSLLRNHANQGNTVIVATHESEANKYSDMIVHLMMEHDKKNL